MKSGDNHFIRITILLLLFTSSLSAQHPSEKIHVPWRLFQSREEEKKSCKDSVVSILPEYFLLGTLRFFNEQKNQIDCYYEGESVLLLVDFLKDYILQQLKINISIEKGKDKINLLSVELTKIMDNYFDKNGLLDISFFDSKEKIYSYLSGYYLRSGSKLGEDIYSFNRLNNISPYPLLEKAGCQKIIYLHTKYQIPGGSVYYFEPSVPLEKYFDFVEKEMINKIQYTKEITNKVIDKENNNNKTKIGQMAEQIFNEFE